MWDPVPWPGIEPGPPALRTQSLNCWTTREVPSPAFFYSLIISTRLPQPPWRKWASSQGPHGGVSRGAPHRSSRTGRNRSVSFLRPSNRKATFSIQRRRHKYKQHENSAVLLDLRSTNKIQLHFYIPVKKLKCNLKNTPFFTALKNILHLELNLTKIYNQKTLVEAI